MSPALQANSLPSEPPGKPIYIGLLLLLLSHSLMSDSLWPHGLQHAKVSCPSCPMSQWCHPTISSSVVPFFCPQSHLGQHFFPCSNQWGYLICFIYSDTSCIHSSVIVCIPSWNINIQPTSFLIYSSLDGHLGCFHILVIKNSAAVNTGVCLTFQISAFVFFRYMSRSGISGSFGCSIFSFLIKLHTAFVNMYFQFICIYT